MTGFKSDWEIALSAAENILGTQDLETTIAEKNDIEVDLLLEALTDRNIERCPGCDVWVEAGELADEDGNERLCSSCSSPAHEEQRND